MMKSITIRAAVVLGMVAAFSLLFISCATLPHRGTLEAAQVSQTGTFDSQLAAVQALFHRGEYQDAADLLRSLMTTELSHSRMETLMRWLERCELCLTDPFKTKRYLAMESENLRLPG